MRNERLLKLLTSVGCVGVICLTVLLLVYLDGVLGAKRPVLSSESNRITDSDYKNTTEVSSASADIRRDREEGSSEHLSSTHSFQSSNVGGISSDSGADELPLKANVHAFYYPWYGSPKVDKQWLHWNHERLKHWRPATANRYSTEAHKPPEDIGADFYPKLGPYSSADPEIIDDHMRQLREANVGTIVVSWYAPKRSDSNGKAIDWIFPLLLDKCDKNGLKLSFHMEPYKGRSTRTVREDIEYVINTYGEHPALYRTIINGSKKPLPLFYIYDSYDLTPTRWGELFNAKGNKTVRGTKYDGIFIGLLVKKDHSRYVSQGGFDGMYSYFAVNGMTYGSRQRNWPTIAKDLKTKGGIFIPSVGPGYIDEAVRPWNGENTRKRNKGAYYKSSIKSALDISPEIISITSFNEWHEGTQIEEAINPKVQKPDGFKTFNLRGTQRSYFYYENGSDMYLKLTNELLEDF
eukprot:TRINITY_DN96363_c0_g1_i1.p1 TRINITY_DN96363_c0_g1~~TRINITY_DN96363_c0_g1_i1.p1  ORF type:complete len:463 (-),score=92.67 TRINITY_DN96363_c0_g1_i1:187-1575(-)